MKVFLQRSLDIFKENGQRHNEALNKITSFEVEVTKWRAIAWTLWRVEHPKVANTIVALAKLVSTRLDGNEVFKRCKDLFKERNDLATKVERASKEKEKLNVTVAESAKVITDLQAQLRELELTMSSFQTKMKEFKLKESKEKEEKKKLEENLLMCKREVVE